MGVSRQKITRLESMGNQFGFLFKGWSRYRMSKAIVVSPTAITCFFLFSKYVQHEVIVTIYLLLVLLVKYYISIIIFQDWFERTVHCKIP